jgi:tetratricopeptide (TPR) repeat protein
LIAFHVIGDSELAGRRWTEAAELARQLGKEEELELIEGGLASVIWEQGDLERAMRLRQEMLARARARGDRLREAMYLHWTGEILGELERFDEAERLLLEADAIYRELGKEPARWNNVHSLGDVALDRHDFASAATRYRETLESARATARSTPRHQAYCLAGLASVLAEIEQDEVAARVWGAVCAAEETLGFRLLPRERRRYERHVARLESTDGWVAGRELTLEEAEVLVASALAAAGP